MTSNELKTGHKYIIKKCKLSDKCCAGCVVELRGRELFFTGIHLSRKQCAIEGLKKDTWCFDLHSPKGDSIEYEEYLELMPITGHPMVIGEL